MAPLNVVMISCRPAAEIVGKALPAARALVQRQHARLEEREGAVGALVRVQPQVLHQVREQQRRRARGELRVEVVEVDARRHDVVFAGPVPADPAHQHRLADAAGAQEMQRPLAIGPVHQPLERVDECVAIQEVHDVALILAATVHEVDAASLLANRRRDRIAEQLADGTRGIDPRECFPGARVVVVAIAPGAQAGIHQRTQLVGDCRRLRRTPRKGRPLAHHRRQHVVIDVLLARQLMHCASHATQQFT